MSEITKIPIELKIRGNTFVSAANLTKIISLTERAIFNVERHELTLIKEHFPDIPDVIFEDVELKLLKKSGNALLVKEASNGCILLGGFAAGLCVWLLNQTIGETFKEAWLESDGHHRLKEFLLRNLETKKELIGKSVQKSLEANNIQTGLEITETVSAYISQTEDPELSKALEKPRQTGPSHGMR